MVFLKLSSFRLFLAAWVCLDPRCYVIQCAHGAHRRGFAVKCPRLLSHNDYGEAGGTVMVWRGCIPFSECSAFSFFSTAFSSSSACVCVAGVNSSIQPGGDQPCSHFRVQCVQIQTDYLNVYNTFLMIPWKVRNSSKWLRSNVKYKNKLLPIF